MTQQREGFIFAIDPSSTCTGWASIHWRFFKMPNEQMIWRDEFVKVEVGGTIKPKNRKSPMIERVASMAEGLNIILGCHLYGEAGTDPLNYEIIIEVPGGKVGARHKGGGSGLSIYGFACGYIYSEMMKVRAKTESDMKKDYLYDGLPEVTVRPVISTWMGGQPKLKRQRVAEKYHPEYDASKDKGNDESDAIALAVWWAQKKWKAGMNDHGR